MTAEVASRRRAARPRLARVLDQGSTDKRIDILRRIGECGSISEAARRAGVSYKAAWQAVETLSNLAGTALVDKAVGGSGGGGTVLTAAGVRVLEAAGRLDRARTEALAPVRGRGAAGPGDPGFAALAPRTSMRNQLPCVVRSLRLRNGAVQVTLALPDGALLNARITRESAQLLQLEPGLPVLALCKATAVTVAREIATADPGCNRLQGTVVRASRSVHGGEVTLRLGGTLGLVGFHDGQAVLGAGQPAMAGVDESAVVIALPA